MNASTSASVGGRPVSVNVTRLINVSLSASGEGARPSRASRARRVGNGRPLRRDERPVRSIFGAVLDPLLEDRHLLRRQRLVRRLGRHALVDIRRTDAAYELATGCVAGHDRVLAGRLWELG